MPTFSFDDFVTYAGALRMTTVFTVPPIYMAIAKHPAVQQQFRHVRVATSGAAALTGELQGMASRRMGGDGFAVRQTWGMSETCGAATYCPFGEDVTLGSLGRLLPNVLMRSLYFPLISS